MGAIVGVVDSDNRPVKLSKKRQKELIEDTGAVYCETNEIPEMMDTIAGIKRKK